MEIVILRQMEIEADLAPLSPHYVCFIEIKPNNTLLVLLVSLDVVPPEALFH